MKTPAPITIRADCSDKQLNEAVMLHVENLSMSRVFRVADYATDANAVLPLLEKEPGCFKYWSSPSPRVTYFKDRNCDHPFHYAGTAPTFCRAACFALLRAHGVTVKD